MEGQVVTVRRAGALQRYMIRVAIVALLLTFVGAAVASADDYGPHRGIREVRTAVPILVQARLDELRFEKGTAQVDDTIVGNDDAIVNWHTSTIRGVSALSYRNARWWSLGTIYEWPQKPGWSWWMSDSSTAEYGCPGSLETTTPPNVASIETALHAPPGVAALWSQHASPFASGSPPSMTSQTPPRVNRDCTKGTYSYSWPLDVMTQNATGSTYAVGRIALENADGYRAQWTGPGDWGSSILRGTGRAPTDSEMTGPGANSIFFVYATVGPKKLVAPKSTLTIWCPFVLDTSVHYFIEIAGPDAVVGPVTATLKDNTLAFELPAFTAQPGVDLKGEIDFTPWRPH